MYIVHMGNLSFEWDERKNKENLRKHSIGFEEAQTVFYDNNAIQFFDPDHSENEERFILLGMSFNLHTLVVCHCYHETEWVVRIISARKADRVEEEEYWRHRR